MKVQRRFAAKSARNCFSWHGLPARASGAILRKICHAGVSIFEHRQHGLEARATGSASLVIAFAVVVLLGTFAGAADENVLRLAVTRDTWVSAVDREADANLGGAPQLKLKSIQEMSLIDIDPKPLKGHAVRSATLHVRKRGGEVLHRVTVSSINSEWVEGTSASYQPQQGTSCFHFARYPDVPWAYPGSDLTAVTLGQDGTVWSSAEASPPDAQGWMTIAIDPKVVAARVAGISRGFLLFDDTGSEWTREGEKFKLRLFPNRFIFSREGGKQNAPYLTIELGAEDREAPEAPKLTASPTEVNWHTPPDRGPAQVAGFVAEIDGKPVAEYLLPRPADASTPLSLLLSDLGLAAGRTAKLTLRAVDGAGNLGAPSSITIHAPDESVPPLAGADPEALSEVGPLPKLANVEIAIIDPLDKVQPRTGQMIPTQPPQYLAANHLWSAKEKRIRLHGARNEFVSFQLLLRGHARQLHAILQFEGRGVQPQVQIFRYANVPSKIGPVPDPLLDSDGTYSTAEDEKSGSLLIEIYVPHEMPAGKHAGILKIAAGDQSLDVAVDLTVWNFALPDRLSFIPELNCYGLPDNELDYYRLAHRNRAVINRVPYHQDGSISPGCAPKWDGHRLDWAAWDKRFGKYFDGSAFADLPRRGVPLDVFYLPLHENWPTPMEGNYNGSYWADRAFPPAYREAFVECSRQFAGHFNQKHWNQTIFQCFFNGKNGFKEHGWSHGSCPWILDEPTNFQDFWALRWFGTAFHEGVALAPAGDARMLFRCDISRPQWQRDLLDDVLNYNVVAGGAFRQYRRLVLQRKQKFHQIVIPYGSSNDPAESNMQPVGWCWDNWTHGADGVLPWQVIGDDSSWKHGEDTCLFYPGAPVGQKAPIPSIRLKAYLRGEQDAEYLVLLAKVEKRTQLEVGEQVRRVLALRAQRKSTGFVGDEDAGVIDFADLRPQDVWRIRERIGQLISNDEIRMTNDESNSKHE
jgi:hypothetical protein